MLKRIREVTGLHIVEAIAIITAFCKHPAACLLLDFMYFYKSFIRRTMNSTKIFLSMCFLAISALASAQGDRNLVSNPGFENTSGNMPEGWKSFFPRKEIAPEFCIDNSVSHSGKNSMKMTASGKGTYGYLSASFNGIESRSAVYEHLLTLPDSVFMGENSYLAGCHFRVSENIDPDRHIRVKISWFDSKNNELFSEFLRSRTSVKGWHRVAEVKTAPLNATGMSISLVMQWPEQGTVWWDDVFVEKAPALAARVVKIASSSAWPKYPSTVEKNLQFYSGMVDRAGARGADIICLGEGITLVSTGKSYSEVAETIPGPTSKTLGEAAKRAGTYVIAGIYEKEGSLIYNTAILIGRDGNIAGKYRKTHLPQTEVEGGLTPGDTYPVFKTDFGTVGIEICYDNFFPEVARNLMLNGAEIVFCPIWGDIRGMKDEWNAVARTRAIDNAVFFVASMYEPGMSLISDPNGHLTRDDAPAEDIIFSAVDLNMRTFERWLSVKSYGEWQNLFRNERRPETY